MAVAAQREVGLAGLVVDVELHHADAVGTVADDRERDDAPAEQLGEQIGEPRYIVTVRGLGYRSVA